MFSEVGGKNHNNKQTKTTPRIPTDWHLNMGRAVCSQWVGNGTRVALGPQWAPLHFNLELLSFSKRVLWFGSGEEMRRMRGPHPEAWQVARDCALGRLPLPGPAPGRTRVRTPRSPPRGEPSPGCGPAGLGGQGAARAKGQRRPGRPRVAGAVGGGRGPRGRAHISAKFPDGRSLPARSAFPALPGSALRTQKVCQKKKCPARRGTEEPPGAAAR